ncbi:MAG: flavodoxin domain-containing protein [Candidatus Firestonebacteria bacterium]
MSAVKIKEGVYWVGAVDWNVRSFHGHTFNTKRGTTYNSYLIVDEKIALIDSVYAPFSQELLANISEIVPPEKIDYMVVNHVEGDHSGSVPEILKYCPKAKVVGTEKCKTGMYKHYYGNWDWLTVKTGDKINLGKKTLTFVEAPMLHWPDSMFTYIPELELLLPNDAFGQHISSSKRFDDEIDQSELMDEAASYYANILLPFSPMVLKKIDEVVKMGIKISMIAPSHGIIWRKDPMKIINAYVKWAKNETTSKVVIAYETMWKSTELMAKTIGDGVASTGVGVVIADVSEVDKTNVIKEMLDAKGYLIGSATHGNDMLPQISGFLAFLKGMKPKGRIGAAFGSYGWSGGAAKSIEEVLTGAGINIVQPFMQCQFVPDKEELKKLFEYGVEFGKKIKNG